MSASEQDPMKNDRAKAAARRSSGEWIDVAEFSSKKKSKPLETESPSSIHTKNATAAMLDAGNQQEFPEPPVLIPRRVLAPEYAIGQKLITRDEYNALKSTYLAESQICFGLILPFGFLAIAIIVRDYASMPWYVVAFVAVVAMVFSAWAGIDRLHKYHSEVQGLIVSRYLVGEDAKRNQPAAPKLAIAAIEALSHELQIQIAALKIEIPLRAEEAQSSQVYIDDSHLAAQKAQSVHMESDGLLHVAPQQHPRPHSALNRFLIVLVAAVKALGAIKDTLSAASRPASKATTSAENVELPPSGNAS